MHNKSIDMLLWKIMAIIPVVADNAQQQALAVALGIHSLFSTLLFELNVFKIVA